MWKWKFSLPVSCNVSERTWEEFGVLSRQHAFSEDRPFLLWVGFWVLVGKTQRKKFSITEKGLYIGKKDLRKFRNGERGGRDLPSGLVGEGRGWKVRGCRLCHDGIYIGRVIFLRVPLPLWSPWKPCDPPNSFALPLPPADEWWQVFQSRLLGKGKLHIEREKKEKDFLGKPFWKELIGWNIFSSTLRRWRVLIVYQSVFSFK